MGDAQRVQAENDIAAKRQVIRAQIDALLEKFPILKTSPEGISTPADSVSGAAAQNTSSKFQNLPNNKGYTAWIPTLRASDPNYHHFMLPNDHVQGTDDTQWHDPYQQGDDKYSGCSDYQKIFQDKRCYQNLQIEGGTHLSMGGNIFQWEPKISTLSARSGLVVLEHDVV